MTSLPVLRLLTWFHRWSSIFLCLLFALWFASGAVMLFVPFPSLSKQARLEHAEIINLSSIGISPAQALASSPAASSLKLISVLGRPVYVLGGTATVIDAQSGAPRAPLTHGAAQLIAERFSGAHARQVDTIDYDQWVVHQGFDAGRPYHRVQLDDPEHTTLYVSQSGEVVQRTTQSQRWMNFAGAVVHWIYFTPVRQHWSVWDQLVWWLSLLALIGASVGMGLGIYRFIQARRMNRAGLAVYRGWLRWHHLLGLFAGTLLLGWILSGWLSMDHGRLFSRGATPEAQQQRFYGRTLAQLSSDISLESLREWQASDLREIQLQAIGGHSFAAGYSASAAQLHFVDSDSVDNKSSGLSEALILSAARSAWPDAQVEFADSEAADLYTRAEEAGDARVLKVTEHQVRLVYVDAYNGQLLANVDASRRAYAWVYYALHTYKFPGLVNHNIVRISLMLALLSAGFALSITGVVLAVKHLAKMR